MLKQLRVAVLGLGACALSCAQAGAPQSNQARAPAIDIASDETRSAPEAPAPARRAGTWFPAFPTLGTAGADDCVITKPTELSAHSEGAVSLGFGPEGGVAVFRRDATALTLQPITPDGGKRGKSYTVAVTSEARPEKVFWVDAGFVILLVNLNLQHYNVAWTAVLFAPGKPPKSPVDIALDGMSVRVGQALDGNRIGLILGSWFEKAPGRWQTLSVEADGSIRSLPQTVAVDDLDNEPGGSWEPAELRGVRGWVVLKDGKRKPDGVFGGKRLAADAANALAPSDVIVASIDNSAVPPPPGPGGRIREARGKPTLIRDHRGQRVGRSLPIEWDGLSVRAIGMNVRTALFWSGSRFLYPYDDGERAMLLPIDCSPR